MKWNTRDDAGIYPPSGGNAKRPSWRKVSRRRWDERITFNGVLTICTLSVLIVLTYWFHWFPSRLRLEAEQPVSSYTGEGENKFKVVFTRLVAREVASATTQSHITAATAELVSGGKGLHLQQVEARFEGLRQFPVQR